MLQPDPSKMPAAPFAVPRSLENATLVVRNGIIESVGTSVNGPAN
jgi:hypothetical protein